MVVVADEARRQQHEAGRWDDHSSRTARTEPKATDTIQWYDTRTEELLAGSDCEVLGSEVVEAAVVVVPDVVEAVVEVGAVLVVLDGVSLPPAPSTMEAL